MAPKKIRFEERNSDPYFQTLKARAAELVENPLALRRATGAILFKAALWGSLLVGAYGAMFFAESGLAAMSCAMVAALSALFIAFGVAHDAAHHSLQIPRKYQDVLFELSMVPIGVDPYLWQMRHLGSHHILPNVNGCDADIDDNPFIRLSPQQPRRPLQRFQHLYAPFIYMVVVPYTALIEDFVYLRKKNLANMRDIQIPKKQICLFFAYKALYLLLWLILPLALLPYSAASIIAGYFLANAVVSTIFVLGSAGTHFSTLAEFPEPSADASLPGTWAKHQLQTSVDFATESRAVLFLTGGFNCHAAHHLFPSVPHPLYRELSRVIALTSKEYGIRYNATSLPGMIGAHFGHLRNLARTAELRSSSMPSFAKQAAMLCATLLPLCAPEMAGAQCLSPLTNIVSTEHYQGRELTCRRNSSGVTAGRIDNRRKQFEADNCWFKAEKGRVTKRERNAARRRAAHARLDRERSARGSRCASRNETPRKDTPQLESPRPDEPPVTYLCKVTGEKHECISIGYGHICFDSTFFTEATAGTKAEAELGAMQRCLKRGWNCQPFFDCWKK